MASKTEFNFKGAIDKIKHCGIKFEKIKYTENSIKNISIDEIILFQNISADILKKNAANILINNEFKEFYPEVIKIITIFSNTYKYNFSYFIHLKLFFINFYRIILDISTQIEIGNDIEEYFYYLSKLILINNLSLVKENKRKTSFLKSNEIVKLQEEIGKTINERRKIKSYEKLFFTFYFQSKILFSLYEIKHYKLLIDTLSNEPSFFNKLVCLGDLDADWVRYYITLLMNGSLILKKDQHSKFDNFLTLLKKTLVQQKKLYTDNFYVNDYNRENENNQLTTTQKNLQNEIHKLFEKNENRIKNIILIGDCFGDRYGDDTLVLNFLLQYQCIFVIGNHDLSAIHKYLRNNTTTCNPHTSCNDIIYNNKDLKDKFRALCLNSYLIYIHKSYIFSHSLISKDCNIAFLQTKELSSTNLRGLKRSFRNLIEQIQLNDNAIKDSKILCKMMLKQRFPEENWNDDLKEVDSELQNCPQQKKYNLAIPSPEITTWVHGHDGVTNAPKGISINGVQVININSRLHGNNFINGVNYPRTSAACVILRKLI